MLNRYRVEAATDRGTHFEWWPVREWTAPYSEVMQYLASKERKYPNVSFRVVMVC